MSSDSLPIPALRAWALRALGGAAGPPPGFAGALAPAVGALLEGWRPLATSPAARERLAARLTEQLARLHATCARHPDNPRSDPRAADPARLFREAWSPEQKEARFGALGRQGWSALLEERVLAAHAQRVAAWEEQFLSAGIAAFQAESEAQRLALGRIGRALGVGLELLGLGADWSAGFFTARRLAALEETAARLERSPRIREILARLGRIDAASPHRAATARASVRRAGPTGLRGLTLSGDLNRVIPGVLAGLGQAETEAILLLGLAENRLLSWDLSGPERATEAVGVRRSQPGGAIVVCIDTSASMEGEAEAMAKATALAALRLALRQGRACRLVSFSSATDFAEIEATQLPGALPEILDFLLNAFHGGTEPGAALRRLSREPGRLRGADVLLVSDGRFEAAELKEGADALRALGARVFGLGVGPAEGLTLCEPPEVAGLLREIAGA